MIVCCVTVVFIHFLASSDISNYLVTKCLKFSDEVTPVLVSPDKYYVCSLRFGTLHARLHMCSTSTANNLSICQLMSKKISKATSDHVKT